jgi:hypothetical protein
MLDININFNMKEIKLLHIFYTYFILLIIIIKILINLYNIKLLESKINLSKLNY